MNIIDNTYFKNDLYIPLGVDTISGTVNTNSPNNKTALEDCITEVEKSILLNALGLTAYNELQTALADLPSADQKWKDLVNGVEYDGKVWIGLNNPKSLITYAVYYFFLTRISQGFYTAVGVSKPSSENATLVTPAYKLAASWQAFLKKYQSGYLKEPFFSNVNGVDFIDWFGCSEEIEVSLYRFLSDKKEDYTFDASKFSVYESINSFGI